MKIPSWNVRVMGVITAWAVLALWVGLWVWVLIGVGRWLWSHS